jgi:hypothetical protein
LNENINTEGYLRVWDFKLDLFTNENQNRTMDSHLFRKAKNRLGSPKSIIFDKHSEQSVCLDDGIADNFLLLKETLNKTNLYISYDTATYHSIIAALCGATSVVVPDKTHTKEEWIQKLPMMKYGVAWGLEDVDWAVQTKDKVREHLLELEKESNQMIDDFIQNTTNKFKSIKQFWRTTNNQLVVAGQVYDLGFDINNAYCIPDEYLQAKNFVILRTCFGLGDWGIISAFPRKLKEKYPDCKVWISSPKLLKQMFGQFQQNWSSWNDPFQVVHTIFDNNPYVDGFIDSFEGEVFNDHFRVYDGDKDEPLLQQMMRFWQFTNFDDIEPELYFSEEEHRISNEIILQYVGERDFGTLLLSNRWMGEGREKIQKIINEYNLPIIYWTGDENHGLYFNGVLNMKTIDNMRIQLCLKTKGKFSIGNQTGVNDTIAKYTTSYVIPRGILGSNIIQSANYI